MGQPLPKHYHNLVVNVLAIDKDPECVQRVSEFATKAVIGDITDQQFLIDLGVEEFDVGIVAIGNHLEESLLGVLNLKEIGVPYIIAKAKTNVLKLSRKNWCWSCLSSGKGNGRKSCTFIT